MKTSWTLFAIVTFGVLALATIRLEAQSVNPSSPTYSWHGELVSFDEPGRAVTVKSRVVGDQALREMPQFKPGDKIVLTWSGFDMYADGIATVARYDASKKWDQPFTFPVEFVAYGTPSQYLTFKFQAPVGSVSALKSLKAGEWITGIAKHRAASEAEAITAVNAYAASSSRTSTN
jgi:hypothetical protein